jgi:DNA repair protein RecO (recombination protein O)
MLVATPAVVLRTFPYGDTSRIARLATRDLGVQSVIAKGATRPRSPFGGRLQLLSEGTAQFHYRANRDLHTLSAFDVVEQHAALAGDLRRFSAATALAELHLRTALEDPQPVVFEALTRAIRALAEAPPARVRYAALAALWHAVTVIGFGPVTDACVRCERELGESASFALAEGGLLCAVCGRGRGRGRLRTADQVALRAFCAGESDTVDLPERYLIAHRRLLGRFIRRHVTDDRSLPALTFWEAVG